jgi:hypothetical protein
MGSGLANCTLSSRRQLAVNGVTTGKASASAVPESPTRASLREWIGAKLEFHHLARRAFAAFDVERRSAGVGRPQSPALPADLRIVDASIQTFSIEALRIGDAQASAFPALPSKCFVGVHRRLPVAAAVSMLSAETFKDEGQNRTTA